MHIRKWLSSPTAVRLIIASAYMSVLIILGTIIFSEFDRSLSEAFYFTIQTLFSVGYGDVPPVTDSEKILTTIFIILGITGFLAAVGIIGASLIQKYAEKSTRLDSILEKRKNNRHNAVKEWGERHNIDSRIISKIIENLKEGEKK